MRRLNTAERVILGLLLVAACQIGTSHGWAAGMLAVVTIALCAAVLAQAHQIGELREQRDDLRRVVTHRATWERRAVEATERLLRDDRERRWV